MTLTPSQSLMSATFSFLLLLGRDDHRLLAGDRGQRDLGALRLIREQVLERFGVVLVLGEQAAKDLDLAAVLGELLLLRDRRVVDVDVERHLALGVDDQLEDVEDVAQVEQVRVQQHQRRVARLHDVVRRDHAAPRVLERAAPHLPEQLLEAQRAGSRGSVEPRMPPRGV